MFQPHLAPPPLPPSWWKELDDSATAQQGNCNRRNLTLGRMVTPASLKILANVLSSCVGQAIVQGDEGPVSEVAQGVQVHGVTHGEKEEGEVEQEVEGEKEENNTQRRRHMCMDGMKVKRHMRAALSHVECDVNTSDDATTDCVQCAQCCMVSSSACVALFTTIVHNVLNVGEDVLVVVHNVP